MRKIILSLFTFSFILSYSQDTLPSFSAVNKGNNRVVVSWYNKYALVKQISIQRSPDSLNNFKTIATVPDPMNRQNGYFDSKAPDDKVFYRLYILVDGSNFVFTRPKRAFSDSVLISLKKDTVSRKEITDSAYIKVVNKIIKENIPDSALTVEEINILKKYKNGKLDLFSDSVSKKINAVLKTVSRPELTVPLYHIITNSDGLVKIMLNDFNQKKYTIKFFEDDDTFLFEIKEIREASLLMDKSNFYHSGWFKSELYDSGKLIERNRFFIPKDF